MSTDPATPGTIWIFGQKGVAAHTAWGTTVGGKLKVT